MRASEFDKFADEYRAVHADNIALSGEDPDFFHAYKVADTAALVGEPQRVERILDFGAGVGNSLPYLKRHFPAAAVTCLDVSEKSLRVAEERFPDQAEFVRFDGRSMGFDTDIFDLAFTACVFHHIPHEEHAGLLAEINRVLRPGGLFVAFEHNPYNPLTVRAVNSCPFDENAVLIKPGDFARRFREAGFEEVGRRYRIFFPGPLRGLRIFEPAMTWLPLGAQYSICGRKPA